VVFSAPLTVIDSNRFLPLLGIHRTVLALRLSILHEDVSIEELAQHAAVKVLDVPLGFSLACSSATGGFEWLTIVEQLIAHVLNRSQRLCKGCVFITYSIVTVAVTWGVNCNITERLAAVAGNRSHSLADITWILSITLHFSIPDMQRLTV
jgi:hypothetical protein